MKINIGIEEAERKEIAKGLTRLLADSYSLYLKTHAYHWNVKGPWFQTLHLMFETQYTDLALAVDLIAERIRALGFPAPGVPNAESMVEQLVEGQESVIRTARALSPLVRQVSDETTADLLTQRMQVHEKNAWMLRSLLEK